jgi:hypothetical protein
LARNLWSSWFLPCKNKQPLSIKKKRFSDFKDEENGCLKERRKVVFKGHAVKHEKDLPLSPATLRFVGDKSWLNSAKNPFIQRMSHGPTPLKNDRQKTKINTF